MQQDIRAQWPTRFQSSDWGHDRGDGHVCVSSAAAELGALAPCKLPHACQGAVKVDSAEDARMVFQHGKPCGGVKAAYKTIEFENLVDWGDAIKQIRKAMKQHVLVKLMAPRHVSKGTDTDITKALAQFEHTAYQRGLAPTSVPPLLGMILEQKVLPGINWAWRAQRALKKQVRKHRRHSIRMALASRLACLDDDIGQWHKRIKRHGVLLRTDACWGMDGLVLDPYVVRDHYASQVAAVETWVSPPTQHPYAALLPKFGSGTVEQLSEPFTESEVRNQLKRMRSRSAPGPSGICSRLLSCIPISTATRLCNRAMIDGQVPSNVKQSYVRLLNKTEDVTPHAGKFRPIVLPETPYTLLTGLLQSRLLRALVKNDYILDDTFAFGARTSIKAP